MIDLNCQLINVKHGDNLKVIQPVNIYGCKIGNDCFVGPFVEMQRGVAMGNDIKIQSHGFVCELVEIDNNCFIGHGVTFINDTLVMGNQLLEIKASGMKPK